MQTTCQRADKRGLRCEETELRSRRQHSDQSIKRGCVLPDRERTLLRGTHGLSLLLLQSWQVFWPGNYTAVFQVLVGNPLDLSTAGMHGTEDSAMEWCLPTQVYGSILTYKQTQFQTLRYAMFPFTIRKFSLTFFFFLNWDRVSVYPSSWPGTCGDHAGHNRQILLQILSDKIKGVHHIQQVSLTWS